MDDIDLLSLGIKIIAVTRDARKQDSNPGQSSNPDRIIQSISYWILKKKKPKEISRTDSLVEKRIFIQQLG